MIREYHNNITLYTVRKRDVGRPRKWRKTHAGTRRVLMPWSEYGGCKRWQFQVLPPHPSTDYLMHSRCIHWQYHQRQAMVRSVVLQNSAESV
jgi:hypothetical protein